MSKRKSNQKIVAHILRNAENQPFVKVEYDFGNGLHDSFDLSTSEEQQASEIFHKFKGNDGGVIKYNPETKVTYSGSDKNRSLSPAYITGSEPGIENCKKTIEELACATGGSDIMTPFYVGDGKTSIFYNEAYLVTNGDQTISVDEAQEIRDMELKKDQVFNFILKNPTYKKDINNANI